MVFVTRPIFLAYRGQRAALSLAGQASGETGKPRSDRRDSIS